MYYEDFVRMPNIGVTDEDYWVSLPLEGFTKQLLMLAVSHHTPHTLNQEAVKQITDSVSSHLGETCKYCTRRRVSRLFLICGPEPEQRVRGFRVCETCADKIQMNVGGPPPYRSLQD